ncbi:alpha/beta hydrolase [Methanosphaera sp.]|uniref:alpha/beta fold hydrolase n=1 Tax=Methanosphaera sp. TaxID=2666342 RepID=UPI0025D2DBEE|nr:alpha/beta hydrolase [Methanosphaera sp.]
MNFKIEGNGRPLVFIHGLSDSLLYWEFLASHLKRDYQIIRMDLRGHGESYLGNDEVNIDLYVSDLKNLLDDLNLDNVDLIGFSLGGAVALDFSLKYPENVSSLVLMSSFSKSDEYLTNIFTQFKDALKNSLEDFYDLILPMVLCPEVIDDNREALDQIREFASKTANTDAYIKAVDACMEFDVDDSLSKIEVPTLVMSGKYDEISLLSSQKTIQKKIKNSELIVFDNVKHNLLVGKNNERVLEVLEKFYS